MKTDRRLGSYPGSMRFLVAAASVVAVLALSGGAGAQGTTLVGTVGPGFTITLKDASGNPVTNLAPGTYTFQINDQASIHNFHLSGPGLEMATGVEQVGTVTWTLTLAAGNYHFQCDPHASLMNGDFTVGSGGTTTTTTTTTAPPPPPAPTPVRLAASVRANGTVVLTRRGVRPLTVKAGPVVIVVSDRSAKANFRLTGPGVNRATSKLGKTAVIWRLTLRRGLYRYGSDSAPAARRSFRAV